jgi:hypothetical protein
VQNKTRLPHRFVFSFFMMFSVSDGYKHREIAIGAKKKNKQHSQQRKPKKN